MTSIFDELMENMDLAGFNAFLSKLETLERKLMYRRVSLAQDLQRVEDNLIALENLREHLLDHKEDKEIAIVLNVAFGNSDNNYKYHVVKKLVTELLETAEVRPGYREGEMSISWRGAHLVCKIETLFKLSDPGYHILKALNNQFIEKQKAVANSEELQNEKNS